MQHRLFGTKNPASGQYERVTFPHAADRVDNLRGALKKLGPAMAKSRRYPQRDALRRGQDYNVALVVPDFAALKADPNLKPLLKDTLEESLKDKAVTDYLSKDITTHLRKTYGGYEVPQKFLFVAEDFTVESGMLTQTFKLKRPLVMKKFGDQLQDLYK